MTFLIHREILGDTDKKSFFVGGEKKQSLQVVPFARNLGGSELYLILNCCLRCTYSL